VDVVDASSKKDNVPQIQDLLALMGFDGSGASGAAQLGSKQDISSLDQARKD